MCVYVRACGCVCVHVLPIGNYKCGFQIGALTRGLHKMEIVCGRHMTTSRCEHVWGGRGPKPNPWQCHHEAGRPRSPSAALTTQELPPGGNYDMVHSVAPCHEEAIATWYAIKGQASSSGTTVCYNWRAGNHATRHT